MITGYHIRNREVSSTPYGDLIWGGLALLLGMYHKPLKLILVAWVFYPIQIGI